MSNEELVIRILSIVVPLILGYPAYRFLKYQIRKSVAEELGTYRKADLDSANTAKIYNELAADSGIQLQKANTEVKTAESRIATLEKLVVDLNRRLEQQELDKKRLEEEVTKRDMRIDFLQKRVTDLENILEANHIAFPINGGIK